MSLGFYSNSMGPWGEGGGSCVTQVARRGWSLELHAGITVVVGRDPFYTAPSFRAKTA